MKTPLHVLLSEDDPAHARLVKETVIGLTPLHRLTWVEKLEDGLQRLADLRIEVVVLDLGLGLPTGWRRW